WVGELGVVKKPWRSSDIRQLPVEVAAARQTNVDRLPDHPLCATTDDSVWSLLEVEPTPAEDYPAQSDIFVGKAMNTEQWENGHNGVPYFSERYSKAGEIFCYLKLDGSEELEGEIFEDKGDIEDALEDALRPGGLGCFFSGGTGYRYSYVDLALTDLQSAIPVVREVLQAGRLTKRSWLLFYDTEWANEWVGIWPDSPPPLLPSEGE
ncbi:MAG: hypothetical protein OEM81_15910, partial [Acidimicrobiia bacterium]|nr:hypothetical protein [Acidimicrobiia bacterium]